MYIFGDEGGQRVQNALQENKGHVRVKDTGLKKNWTKKTSSCKNPFHKLNTATKKKKRAEKNVQKCQRRARGLIQGIYIITGNKWINYKTQRKILKDISRLYSQRMQMQINMWQTLVLSDCLSCFLVNQELLLNDEVPPPNNTQLSLSTVKCKAWLELATVSV